MVYRGKRMRVIGTGLICLDIIHKNRAVMLMNGGTCANVLTVLAQLGEDATVLMPDYYADEQKAFCYYTLEKMKIDTIHYCKTKKRIPRIIEVYEEDRKHRFYTKCHKCDRDLLENRFITEKEAQDLMPQIMNNDMFFTDRISSGIKYIARQFISMNKKVIYEPNSARNLKAVIEMSKLSHVVKFSEDRISIEKAESIKSQCIGSALELIIVTQGDRGMRFSYRINENRFSEWIVGPNIAFSEIRDTSGAGDWLTAGFLHLWNKIEYSMNENDIFKTLQNALNLSALCSRVEGAQGAFYDKELFEDLKREYHIKLDQRMKIEISDVNEDDVGACDSCLI